LKFVTIATAPDQLTAEIWREIVRQAGITCELGPGDVTSFLGLSQLPVRLMTSEADADNARSVLASALSERPEP